MNNTHKLGKRDEFFVFSFYHIDLMIISVNFLFQLDFTAKSLLF